MTWHAIATRLVSYGALLFAARIFMSSVGVWTSYWRQNVTTEPKTIRGFLRFCVPRELYTHPCVRIDISLTVLRKLLGFWGVVPVGAMIAVFSPITYDLAGKLFGIHPHASASLLVGAVMVLSLLLVHDFGEFITHWASHNSRILWEFHKSHHSVRFMTPLSAKRAHFVDDLVRMAVIGPSMGITVGVLSYLFGLPPVESSLFGVDAYVIGNILSFDTLRHSHIPLTYGPVEAIFMSPSQHHLHHNREGKPRNFGSFLSMWDRMFGTWERSLPPGSFTIGLSNADQSNYDSVVKIYVRPFWNVGKYLHKTWFAKKPAPAQSVEA
jgi:sterol desaturase/sphingolipid hydroxylase (fatty acid hydroxylase superfamily)